MNRREFVKLIGIIQTEISRGERNTQDGMIHDLIDFLDMEHGGVTYWWLDQHPTVGYLYDLEYNIGTPNKLWEYIRALKTCKEPKDWVERCNERR